MSNFDPRISTAEQAARMGGHIAMDSFRENIITETKENRLDLLTTADKNVQDAIIDEIQGKFPNDTIIAEEDNQNDDIPNDNTAWIVDPIDGTQNYACGSKIWSNSIAIVDELDSICGVNYMPALDDMYVSKSGMATRNESQISVSNKTDIKSFRVSPISWWDRNEREHYTHIVSEIVQNFGDLIRFGSVQCALSSVADGSIEGAITDRKTYIWDTVAGVQLVRSAGGVVTDIKGDPWDYNSQGLVASNGNRHDEILSIVQD